MAVGDKREVLMRMHLGLPGGAAGLGDNGIVPFSQLPWRTFELDSRTRSPARPVFDLGGRGISGTITLKTKKYTGASDVTACVNGVCFDAENLSTDPEKAPDGYIIIKPLEG